MRVLTADNLDIETLEAGEATALKSLQSFPRPHTVQSMLTIQQEMFLRDRYSTKLEDTRTGRWIRSWRTEG